jgi:hypothetical protein
MQSPPKRIAEMLDELIRSNAVDKRWAEGLIAGAATLDDLERAAIGTADSRWRIARFNGGAVVDEARGASHGEDLAGTSRESLDSFSEERAVLAAGDVEPQFLQAEAHIEHRGGHATAASM